MFHSLVRNPEEDVTTAGRADVLDEVPAGTVEVIYQDFEDAQLASEQVVVRSSA